MNVTKFNMQSKRTNNNSRSIESSMFEMGRERGRESIEMTKERSNFKAVLQHPADVY